MTTTITTIVKRSSLAATLALGLAAASCDAPGDDPSQPRAGTAERGLDEGDQIPNEVARLELGRSTVYFAEPAPGVIMVGENVDGQPVLKPGLPTEAGALWNAIAGGRAMPSALREAVARSARSGSSSQAPLPARAKPVRPAVVASDVADPKPKLGLDALASTIGGSQDPTAFINFYCSGWAYPADLAESCATNRTTSNPVALMYENSGNVHFARAAVAAYRGTLRFVPQWNSFFSWSDLADITLTAGHSSSWSVLRSFPSFGFRYYVVDGSGDGYHRMHFVDDRATDPWGLGGHVIPNNN
jgi:hypothetical protein